MNRLCSFLAFLFFSAAVSANPNTWTRKTSMGGIARASSCSFSIGNKGYVGTGADASFNLLNDFWEYDQSSDSWSQKANFGGGAIRLCVGFSIGTKGYFGTGLTSSGAYNGYWEWAQASNTWTQKANFPGTARCI